MPENPRLQVRINVYDEASMYTVGNKPNFRKSYCTSYADFNGGRQTAHAPSIKSKVIQRSQTQHRIKCRMVQSSIKEKDFF